jgi:hypothetical protein
LNESNSSKQLDMENSGLFIHEVINVITGPPPYTRGYKEDTPSNTLAVWMGIKPMPTRHKG